MTEFTLDNTQALPVTVNPVAVISGNEVPAKLAAPPVFAVTAGNSTFIVSDDGLTAILVSEDGVGDTTYTITGDPGAGADPLVETVILHVTAPAAPTATKLNILGGTPFAKSTLPTP